MNTIDTTSVKRAQVPVARTPGGATWHLVHATNRAMSLCGQRLSAESDQEGAADCRRCLLLHARRAS